MMPTVLAITGSLREASVQNAVLRLVVAQASGPLDAELLGGVGALPLYNPELEVFPPQEVQDLRDRVALAPALLLASPEYSRGVASAMQNVLDWLVKPGLLAGKVVMALDLGPPVEDSGRALRFALGAMGARVVEPPRIDARAVRASLDVRGQGTPSMAAYADEVFTALRRAAARALIDTTHNQRPRFADYREVVGGW